MRIANGFFSTTIQGTLSKNNGDLARIMSQISQERRVLVPSDDPIASVRLRMLDRDAVMLDQYRGNIGALKVRLQESETRLDGMLDTITSGHDLMIWALDGANTSADVNAMSSTLSSMIDRLVAAGNAADSDGNYLFSGTRTDTAPVAYDAAAPLGSRYSYAGNGGTQQVVVGNGVTQSANVNVSGMPDLLNRMEAALEVLRDPAVNVNDPATRDVLAAAETALNQAIDTTSGTIGQLGGARNTLDLLDDSHAALQVSNGEAAQRVDGMDMADLYDQLTQHTVAIQATYQVYGKIMQLNPFDLL